MEPGSIDQHRGSLLRFLLPLLCAVAGGCVYVFFAPNDRFVQILTLLVFGAWGAAMLFSVGLLQRSAFFALGFSSIINPRKFFGMPTGSAKVTIGDASHQFLSFTDLALLIICLLLVFRQLSGNERRVGNLLPKWTLVGLGVYAVAAVASCFTAPDMGRAYAQLAFDVKLLFIVVIFAHVFSDRERIHDYLPVFVYGIAAACTLQFVYVTLEYFNLLRIGKNIMGIPFSVGGQERLIGVSSIYRVTGTYGHANYLGAPMAAVSLLLWELLIANRSILKYRVLVWSIWVAVTVVVMITFSRGAWVALAVAGLSYLPFALKIQGVKWFRAFLRRYAFISIVICVAIAAVFWRPLQNRLFRSDPSAIASRRQLNQVSIQIIAENSVFGGGIGNHIPMTKDKPAVKAMTMAMNAPMPVHSIYLLIATEVGIIGACAYFFIQLSLFVAAAYRCLKYAGDPLSTVCLAFASTFIVFWIASAFSPVTRLVDGAYLNWMMMGVVAGLLRLLGSGPERTGKVPFAPRPSRDETLL